MTEHQSYPNIHLNIPDLHNFDGHGGRPKSELMVTSVEQTVTGKKVFENIEVHDPTSNNQAANKSYADTKLSLTGGTMTGDLILPHHPIPGNTNKVINYESQREIFLSRQESFPMQADINMNNNFIQNIATPTSSHQATNKGYCDYNFLNRQKGGMLMGSLSMNQNDLFEIPAPKYGSSAANKNYVDGEIGKIASVDTTQLIKKDGSVPMAADLDMGTHKIIRLASPTDNSDAANKQYIDEELLKSHLVSSKVENSFKYLSDQDESSSERNIIVHGIQDFNRSPHKNKKAYDIDLIYTSGTQNYDSKIGINLYPLPVGKFTIIMEYYFPEDTNISLLAEASTAIINKQTITNFTSYKKQLVQINQQTKDTPDYLFFTIRGSGTTATNPEGYLVFYGVKEWVDTVPSEIYDHVLETGMFEYDNENMKMQTKIDMNNNKIIKLSNGTDPDDVVNKGQLDSVKNHSEMVKNQLDSYLFYIKNYLYMSIFTHRFYDLKEPSKFILDGPAISGITPGMSIKSSGSSHITVSGFDPIRGLQFNSATKIIIDLGFSVNQNTPYTIMVSLTLKDYLKVHFVDPTNDQSYYYPGYVVNPLDHSIRIHMSEIVFSRKNYPIVFNNKQIMVWIYFNPSERKYEIIIGNGNFDYRILNPLSYFSTNKLRIDVHNNIINKICYQNQHFASAETFTKMMFEERKNGSYF